MNLKGYIKLIIMALAIMFLTETAIAYDDSGCIADRQNYYMSLEDPSGTTYISSYPAGIYNSAWFGENLAWVNGALTGWQLMNVSKNGYYPGFRWINYSTTYSCNDMSIYPIGATVTWDKSEYEKGETATVTVEYNSSNFDTTNWSYQYDIIDPDSALIKYQDFQYTSSETFQVTLNKVGIYQGKVWVSNNTNVFTAIYDANYDNIVVSDGTSVSFISFDHTNYKLGDTSTISWGISSNFWSNFGYRYLEIYKDGVKIDEINSLPYFGTRSYKFPEIGQYYLELWEYSLSSGDVKRSTSLTVWVDYNPSYIIMNNSIPIKTNIYVNYTLGETDTTTDLINVIEAHYLNPNDNSYELEDSCYFNNIASSGSCIMNIDKVGTYLFTLENLRLNLLMDSEIINSYYVDNKPKHNYSTSLINVSKDQWYQGDYISGNYQIEASKFNSSEIYLNYYSNTDSYKYSFFETLLEDTGTFNNFIPGLRTGQNTVYLNYTNASGSGTLAQKSFNVSSITSTGYGLTLSSYEVGLDEIFNIYVTIPPYPSKGKLRVVEQTYNQEVYNVTLNNSMTIPQSSSISGTYSFILSDQSNEVQVMRLLVVKSKTDNTTSTTTTAGSEYGLGDDKSNTGMVTNLIILIGMPIFWGLAFLLGAIYYLRNNSALILPVLFILINVEAVVGLLEPYTMYIVVVTWLVIAMNFIFVQRKTTG